MLVISGTKRIRLLDVRVKIADRKSEGSPGPEQMSRRRNPEREFRWIINQDGINSWSIENILPLIHS